MSMNIVNYFHIRLNKQLITGYRGSQIAEKINGEFHAIGIPIRWRRTGQQILHRLCASNGAYRICGTVLYKVNSIQLYTLGLAEFGVPIPGGSIHPIIAVIFTHDGPIVT